MINVVNKQNHIPTLNNDFYVGRGSPLGNIADHRGSNHPQVTTRVADRAEAILCYDDHLTKAILSGDPDICHALNLLIVKNFRGEDINLVCYCHPLDCHARIIKERVETAKYCINWFSNMRRMDTPIIHQKIAYWTSENFYQAMKLPKDNVEERQRFALLNPFQSKVQIRKIKDLNPEWNDEFKFSVMTYALAHKFAAGTSWRKKLIAFEPEIIESNNWKDTFWGVDIFTGQGANRLGKILTQIRTISKI